MNLSEREGPVAWLPAGMDACALYRMFLPHMSISPSMYYFPENGITDVNNFSYCRVAVVQRLCSKANFAALDLMRRGNIKIVYDLDDNVWSLPAYNPGVKLFKMMRAGFRHCAAMSDVITVSTEPLRVAVLEALLGHKDTKCPPIEVIPNAMDFNLFRPVSERCKRPKDGRIVMGYAGNNTHIGDVQNAFDALPELLAAFPNLYLEFVGIPPPKEIASSERVRVLDYVPVSEYPARLASWQWDLSIAPLDRNRFNVSKSSIKMMEAGAMHIPCVASAVAPYQDFCRGNSLLTDTVLCKTRVDWVRKTSALIADEKLRQDVGEQMYLAAKKYDINVVAKKWQSVFSSITQ